MGARVIKSIYESCMDCLQGNTEVFPYALLASEVDQPRKVSPRSWRTHLGNSELFLLVGISICFLDRHEGRERKLTVEMKKKKSSTFLYEVRVYIFENSQGI